MLLPLRLSSHPFHYPLPRDTENWRKLPNISTQSMPGVMNSCPLICLTHFLRSAPVPKLASLAQVPFLFILKPLAQEWHCPQWVRPFHISLIKKRPPPTCLQVDWIGIFSTESPHSQITPAYVKLTKNWLTHMISIYHGCIYVRWKWK